MNSDGKNCDTKIATGRDECSFHFVDSEGRIRSQQHISPGRYAPIYSDSRWRYGVVKFDPSIDSNISALAFGVWHPDSKVGISMADKGLRDWNGRRVVIPINAGKEDGYGRTFEK